jgi:hypothetical protein
LKICRLDNDGTWQVLSAPAQNRVIDEINDAAVSDSVSVPITRSGTYALFGLATDPQLSNPVIYPNPFVDTAMISFELGAQAEIVVDIFTLAGRNVRTIKTLITDMIFEGTKKIVNIQVDGNDDQGKELANGTYIYKVTVHNNTRRYSKISKFVKTK